MWEVVAWLLVDRLKALLDRGSTKWVRQESSDIKIHFQNKDGK